MVLFSTPECLIHKRRMVLINDKGRTYYCCTICLGLEIVKGINDEILKKIHAELNEFIMKRTDVQNKADYTAEKKKLQGLLERESEIEKKLLSGNHNEDTWRELNQIRYKITVSQAKLDGSFYKGEPSPRGVRTTNVHQYNK